MKKYIINMLVILFTTGSVYGQTNYTDSLKSIISNLNMYLEIHPNDFNSFLKRADCEYELSFDKFGYGFDDKALNDYNMAIKINPNSDTAYNRRGYLYQSLGKDTLAILDFIRAIELNPIYVEAFYNKGISEYSLNNYVLAISDFTKAIELNSNYKSAYEFRAFAKFFIGKNMQSACEDWTKAYKLGSLSAKENLDKYCK